MSNKFTADLYGDNINYKRRRLINTMLMHKDGPIFVIDCYQHTLVVKDILKGVIREVKSEDVSLTPFKLGFVNEVGQDAYYLSRVPLREWIQGFGQSVSYTNGLGPKKLNGEGLYNTIMDIYPTFEKAVEIVNTTYNDTAWNRAWALRKKNILSYKGWDVGTWDKNEMELTPKYEYLKEELNIALNNDLIK